jgi:hypothetical protein
MSQSYNIIASIGSRNSASGYGKISLVLRDEKEIISIATQQANRRGDDLTQHTDISWVGINPDEDGDCEEFAMSRSWNEGEELEAAITEFTHDGYLYEIFKRGEQDAEFIARAADFGLEDEAIAFVE